MPRYRPYCRDGWVGITLHRRRGRLRLARRAVERGVHEPVPEQHREAQHHARGHREGEDLAQEPAGAASLVLTTHQSNERAMRSTLSGLARLSCVLEKPLLLRIGDFTE